MNLFGKLSIIFILLVTLSTSLMFSLTQEKNGVAFTSEIVSVIDQQADQSIESVNLFIKNHMNVVENLASHHIIVYSNSAEEIQLLLESMQSRNTDFYSFSYFTMDRTRIADSRGSMIGSKHKDQDYWAKLDATREIVIDISNSEALGLPVMHIARKVTDNRGNAKGFLVGRIIMDKLAELIGASRLGNDPNRLLHEHLLDETGLILFSSQYPDLVLKEKFKDFDLIQKTVEGKLETEDQLLFISKEQNYLKFGGNRWTLVMSVSKDDAFLPVEEIKTEITWIIIQIVIGVVILALVSSWLFITPIMKLSVAANQIGHGNLDVEINTRSSDEVGVIARQLKKAAGMLAEHTSGKEKLGQQLSRKNEEFILQEEELAEMNKQMKDSLNYAQRIQASMLPDVSGLKRLLSDAFIIFKPKDIVSGDFYWFERVRKGRNEYLIIACADCTGHGVPGAIMSIMGSNQLTNIVYYQGYLEPQKILARLDKGIKFELYREGDWKNAEKRDGMEIGVCVIDLEEDTLEFAGAGIPLYQMRNNELEIHKSPKLMIGGIDGDEKEVEEQLKKVKIDMLEGDRFYLASDGFQDQFGGASDKKFMSKAFRELIVKTSTLKMSDQKEQLTQSFENWKGEQPQTDDVVVIGIEV